jgi:hypothetical protein
MAKAWKSFLDGSGSLAVGLASISYVSVAPLLAASKLFDGQTSVIQAEKR